MASSPQRYIVQKAWSQDTKMDHYTIAKVDGNLEILDTYELMDPNKQPHDIKLDNILCMCPSHARPCKHAKLLRHISKNCPETLEDGTIWEMGAYGSGLRMVGKVGGDNADEEET